MQVIYTNFDASRLPRRPARRPDTTPRNEHAFCVGKRPDLATHLPWAIAAVATRAFRVNGVVQLLPLVEKMNHSSRGGRLVVTSAGELALLAGATYAVGDEVFLNYFDGQDASTPERVLAHYGFEPAAAC